MLAETDALVARAGDGKESGGAMEPAGSGGLGTGKSPWRTGAGTVWRKRVACPLALLSLAILAWQWSVTVFGLPPSVVPAPMAVARALRENFAAIILPDLLFTLRTVGGGYVISILAGFSLAALCAQSKWLTRSVTPVAVMFMVLPNIILIPIFMVFLGFSPLVRVIAVALQCAPIIALNTLAGFTDMEKSDRESLVAHGCSRWQIFRKYTLYKAMPQIFAGLKLGSIISIIVALGADFAMGKTGLGYRIKISSSMVALDMVFATIIVAALVGVAMFEIVSLVEKSVIVWKQGAGGDT
ncbi:MAG: ABC transporter permease subunit [Deltaproteobacteria bacterium]|nr:ABC transporter permease subunit [Deltaproteobacteria bacterium]